MANATFVCYLFGNENVNVLEWVLGFQFTRTFLVYLFYDNRVISENSIFMFYKNCICYK